MTVKGTASAAVGVNLNGDINLDRIVVFATPYVTAGVSASASIGVACANASIEGKVDALDIELPSTLEFEFDDLAYDLDVDLDYELLDGKIKVKLSYCLGNASKTLVNYDGWSSHRNVFDASGSF